MEIVRIMSHVLRIVVIASTGLALIACGNLGNDESDVKPKGFQLVSAESEGMDPDMLELARSYAFQEDKNTQSVVIIRNGKIVSEWYEDGKDQTALATSWSMAKSVASALIGIAIERGEIESVDVPLARYFPEWDPDQMGAITLRHLLEMRSGIEWDENKDAPVLAGQTEDQLAKAIDRVAVAPPGVQWTYSSADSMLLNRIIEQATGVDVARYAKEVLFDPIGMNAEWWVDSKGQALTYCCIDATSRDFALFGLLFAQGGRYGDKQVIPEAWVRDSTNSINDVPNYGLHWWVNGNQLAIPEAPESVFYAAGYHQQRIYVAPDQKLVVVRNSFYQRTTVEPKADPGVGILTRKANNWNEALFLVPILKSIK